MKKLFAAIWRWWNWRVESPRNHYQITRNRGVFNVLFSAWHRAQRINLRRVDHELTRSDVYFGLTYEVLSECFFDDGLLRPGERIWTSIQPNSSLKPIGLAAQIRSRWTAWMLPRTLTQSEKVAAACRLPPATHLYHQPHDLAWNVLVAREFDARERAGYVPPTKEQRIQRRYGGSRLYLFDNFLQKDK